MRSPDGPTVAPASTCPLAQRPAPDGSARSRPGVAPDLHPDFHSTHAAFEIAHRFGIPAIGVQHHHAHLAAVLAEHGHLEPALGVAMDGVGLGSDGGIWGGELMLLEGAGFERLGHLSRLAMPGGERAATEPWRMAAAVLHRLGRADEIAERFAGFSGAERLATLIDRPLLSPPCTSLGRWFDAAAGLLGICGTMAFEAEAPMRLEAAARAYGPAMPAVGQWRIVDGELDLSPLLGQLADERDPARGAAVFHASLVAALDQWVAAAARDRGVRTVALAGGCMLNRLLAEELPRRLGARGFKVLLARQAPPNDGGIALGQAWIAIRRIAEGL